ncbi:hypothetical protein [Modestobacter italicus]|uniref:hypothetical protein n=1 Tax=Modestobacter italicus (strain DSM 44449 / CECT 9708 / BC 501) TaxID=2732864 RepID=UPI001C972FF6|nr:hypothetical protein [Modestobacter italicus]
MTTQWRRPSRPIWLAAAACWLAYLVGVSLLRNWPLALLGCLQVAFAAGMAWDARWTPRWWPRRRTDRQRGSTEPR